MANSPLNQSAEIVYDIYLPFQLGWTIESKY